MSRQTLRERLKAKNKQLRNLRNKVQLTQKELLTVAAIAVIAIGLAIKFYFLAPPPFNIAYRDDLHLEFPSEIRNLLNERFKNAETEQLYCLEGTRTDTTITITNIMEPDIYQHGRYMVTPQEDPACQYPDSIGSLHFHLNVNCKPSQNDIFTWGEMRNPEPLINGIQCGVDEFYIVVMPGEHEAFDFRSLRVS